MVGNDTDAKDNPYSRLEDRSIWRKAVADIHPFHLEALYRGKFEISAETAIVTAGSCFAQHISRALQNNGFNFADFEPAPPLFPADKARLYNYGVYSARYGNIYTARQLHQTFNRAFGDFEPVETPWAKGQGVVDPFRPALEPEPFATFEEMVRCRQSHLEAVRELFCRGEVFVLTLGLTEAWQSKTDGAVFPVCPGTLAGTFDDVSYEFKNFNYFEIFEDLVALFGKIRKLNNRARFLLTVSPVPLTATKSDNHVLIATMYSKSVLRAVAGHLAQEIDFVDYFPSYEIIAAPPMRGMFYEPNMRSVSPSGVDHVMSHFFFSHGFAENRQSGRIETASTPSTGDLEIVCEEMLQAQECGYA